jgi:dTDP-4-amino-4,6-dideoxygalactose transaminase
MTYAGAAESMVGRRDLISVLLPCSDRPYALGTRAIPSVLAQTHRNWELIVVSEGRDNTPMRDAVAGFNDSRIRYEEVDRADYSGEHPRSRAGFGARALNRAQELARGDVLCLLDEETEFFPDHLAQSLQALDANSADLVYGLATEHDLNTGQRTELYVAWNGSLGDSVIHPSSVCYTSNWQAVAFPADGSEPAHQAKWATMLEGGAKFVSLAAPQILSFGDEITGRVRVSMPSLPSTESMYKVVDTVAASRQLSNYGPLNAKLEEKLAEYLGAPYVVMSASGDTALGMAMLLAADQRGDRDEVVLPSYTFPSTANAVMRAGLTPVFCDVEPDTLCASASTVAPLVNERTLAIFPVHAHGIPCDMDELEALANDSGALLISDAAAAMGAQVGTRRVGTFGDMEVFSLSSTKVLTSGEGGFLSLHDDRAAARLREIARYGLDGNFVCVGLGVNGRLPELSAGIALAGMDQLDNWLAARRQAATRYEEILGQLQHVRIVAHRAGNRVGSAKDVALVIDSAELRDQLAERLARYRIETRPYFRPLHLMAPFKHLVRSELDVTDQLADKMLCLPITNEIPTATIDYICGALRHELDDLVSRS